MKKFRSITILVFAAAVIYSLAPAVIFPFLKTPSADINNQTALDRIKDNKGFYFSFIVFGDNHAGMAFNDGASLKMIWHMNREDRFRKIPIDMAVNVGDATLDGKEKQYRAYKKLLGMMKWPVITLAGNHDVKQFGDPFKKYIGQKEFAFPCRNSYFIVLDNEKAEVTSYQFMWLEQELKKASSSYKHIFVMLHKPPFEPYQQDWYNAESSAWAYPLRELFAKYGVRAVFSGHRHMFKHEVLDGVDYFVTGGGGMLTEIPNSEGGYLHYMRVVVDRDDVTYEVRRVSPPLWECLTYYVWKETVYWVRNLYGSGFVFWGNKKPTVLIGTDPNMKTGS